MALFRKKPVTIHAHQLGADGWPDEIWQGVIDQKIILHMDKTPPHAIIHTLEGDHRADIGDYIIRGIAGEFYPCKPDIFAATYEHVEDPQ